MLQILDNVWVGINKNFNLDRDFVLCTKENKDMRYPDMGHFSSLDECIKTMADGNFDSLLYWLKKSADKGKKGANLFVGHEEFAYIVSIYLKSILKKPKVETAHIFYKCYIEKQQMSPFSKSGTHAEYLDVLQEFSPMDLKTFQVQYDKAEPSEYWKSVPSEWMPINALLCNYLVSPNSNWGHYFLQRYEERRWEEWVDILQDLAGEILNASANLNRIFKDIRIDIHQPLLPQLKKYKETKWIFDAYDNNWDVYQVRKAFNPHLFLDIIQNVYGHYASKETGMELLVKQMSLTVDKAFREDIESGFKSDYLMNGDDALFFSYVFRLKQEGRVDLLRNFELKQ